MPRRLRRELPLAGHIEEAFFGLGDGVTHRGAGFEGEGG